MNVFLSTSRRAAHCLGATIALSLGSAVWLAHTQAADPTEFVAASAGFQCAICAGLAPLRATRCGFVAPPWPGCTGAGTMPPGARLAGEFNLHERSTC